MSLTVETTSELDELSARFVRDVLPLVDHLYRMARGYTCNHADAEDLVQEVMMRAYRNFHQFTDGTNIRRWLVRIMTNSWISRHRAAMRRPQELLSGDVADAQRSAAVAPSAESRVLQSLGDDEVKKAMQALPENQRTVLYYIDVEGFRYNEVADVLEVPVGTVMSRLYRGRRRMRAQLVNRAVASGYRQTPGTAGREELGLGPSDA